MIQPFNHRLALILACTLAMSGLAQTFEEYARDAGVPVYEFEVLAELPHDTNSFTQGFVYENGLLYESTGRYSQSTVQIIDAKTGELKRRISLDAKYFGEGLTIVGDELIQITWTEGTAFTYNKKDLSKQRTLTYDTEGWGLTTIGNTLIMSDGSSRLSFRDPDDFALDYTVQVRFGQDKLRFLNELEFVHDAVYANILGYDYIVEIKPSTGDVTGIVNCTVLRDQINAPEDMKPMNGIAYDPATANFYLTGKLWPKIFCGKFVRKF
ncbi:MAG: glutaminyl-peptide cyclotransferase [Calditrichota bacterium]